MKKTKVKMNKPVYLGISTLDISKTFMYQSRYDYIKLKYKEKAKLCYMDTNSFVIHIFTEDFFKDINNDVGRWFATSNCDKNDKRPPLTGKNKKIIGMFKAEFCVPRARTYAYLTDNDNENKKFKGTKKCTIKCRIIFNDYKDSVLKNKTILRSQLRFRSDLHIVHREEVNKIAIRNNDDKRLQTFDGVTTCSYGKNAFNVCKSEMVAF